MESAATAATKCPGSTLSWRAAPSDLTVRVTPITTKPRILVFSVPITVPHAIMMRRTPQITTSLASPALMMVGSPLALKVARSNPDAIAEHSMTLSITLVMIALMTAQNASMMPIMSIM